MCDNSPLSSFGAVVSSSASAWARDRKMPLPGPGPRSTRRKQTSRSTKSKGPSFGQVATLRTMSFWTPLEWAMAFCCQARSTSTTRSRASGSLRRRSICVSWASFRVRNKRWQCSANALTPPDRCSTSLRSSFSVWSTPRHVMSRSFASFTTASTTPLHSPKRTGIASPLHFCSSSSRTQISPCSIALCNGGSSRIAFMT
mmetsp:Transcript_109957/g.306447  ORF Transcript_109957/g.306447 Transcript_109957/m.306447 type:complete len:200 (+) Transcript_109957:546-1145(+)